MQNIQVSLTPSDLCALYPALFTPRTAEIWLQQNASALRDAATLGMSRTASELLQDYMILQES